MTMAGRGGGGGVGGGGGWGGFLWLGGGGGYSVRALEPPRWLQNACKMRPRGRCTFCPHSAEHHCISIITGQKKYSFDTFDHYDRDPFNFLLQLVLIVLIVLLVFLFIFCFRTDLVVD